MKKKRIAIIILAVATVTCGVAGSIYAQQQYSKNETAREKPYTVEKQDLSDTLTLTGKIRANESIALRFQTSGRLSWVGVKTGDRVKKNQMIASLDQRDVKKALEKKLNVYMSDRWDFDQTKEDYKEKILNDSIKRILEKSQFNLNNSVLDVELSSLSLEYSRLISPIEGIITRIDTPVAGINISPAGAEFEIINPDSIYFSVLADQNEVISLKSGMEAEIRMDSYPESTISGTISTISFTPKSGESGTVYEAKVLIPVENSALQYRIDMTGDATFVINQKQDILSIPSAYVINDGAITQVWIKKNGKKEKILVETGETYGEMTEILSGLSPGDVIYD